MATKNALVLEGHEIKLRLMADRAERGSFVHIDWLRVTFRMRNCPAPAVDVLFPPSINDPRDVYFGSQQREALDSIVHPHLVELSDDEQLAAASAWEVAIGICACLGAEFAPLSDLLPGRDFYKYRYAIARRGYPVGWVGFLSASKGGKYSSSQDQTIHANLEGMACTFGAPGWRNEMADFIDNHGGLITRADLALDFFEGIQGGFDRLHADYNGGLMDHLGKRPTCKVRDEWDGRGDGRSIYLGSRQVGKLTNFYEKGKQLFGAKDASDWWRAELRYGNQKRVIPSDILRRPEDFFAGASNYHAALLAEHGTQCTPAPIQCVQRLQQQTIEAEVTRSVRWFLDTAAPSALLALRHLPMKALDALFDEGRKLPNRLRKFDYDEVGAAFSKCFLSVAANSGRAVLTA